MATRVIHAATSACMAEVRRLRAAAYGRHVGHDTVWADDGHDADGLVVLAQDTATGAYTGTMRLHLYRLPADADVPSAVWPAQMVRQGRAECSRLAVAAGAGDAKLALWRWAYWHCLPRARWLVMGARSAALARLYRGLGAEPLLPGRVTLSHCAGLGHYLLALDVTGAEAAWRARGHWLLQYMLDQPTWSTS